MASGVLRRYPRTMINRFRKSVQNFEYLLVMDFEATCEKHYVINPQEIIELPCAVLSTRDWKLKDTFHEYIKPRFHPELTPFCTELTGIMQEMVDNQPHFPHIFSKFCEWLSKGGYLNGSNKSVFVTTGNWDLKTMLPNQCKLDDIPLPEHFHQWIDLKHTFCEYIGYYPKSLKDMIMQLQLPLQGRLHSGIDDVKNMVAIIQNLQEKHNVIYKVTSTLHKSNLYLKNSGQNGNTEEILQKDM